jgi:hypothetical protein
MLNKIKSENLIRLSQRHLTILEGCPRQFQDIYLQQLTSVSPSGDKSSQIWGKNFHLLMQQKELGLNLDNFLAENKEMGNCLSSLLKTAPELFLSGENQFREAEHRRNFMLNDYLFTVVYDLLLLQENKGRIIDWKTYPQPTDNQKLISNWQTRLYLYALIVTSDYKPEQISFTYWFVKSPQKPQSLTINYDHKQHEKTHQDLIKLLKRLDHNLENYFNFGFNFNHPSGNQRCKYCQSLNLSEDIKEETYKLLKDDSFYVAI